MIARLARTGTWITITAHLDPSDRQGQSWNNAELGLRSAHDRIVAEIERVTHPTRVLGMSLHKMLRTIRVEYPTASDAFRAELEIEVILRQDRLPFRA